MKLVISNGLSHGIQARRGGATRRQCERASMSINERTKKRLMEIGLSEEYADELATDRTIRQVEKMTSPQVAQITQSSPEEAYQIRQLVVSKDAHDINRRIKFRQRRINLSMSLRSIEDDISNMADDEGLIDMSRLLIDFQDVSEDEFQDEVLRAQNESEEGGTPLQKGIFLELFGDDNDNAVRRACFLIGGAVGVSPAVIDGGFYIQFVRDSKVMITSREVSEGNLKSVVSGLSEIDPDNIAHLNADDAEFLIGNADLAGVDDSVITAGDTVVENFPMKKPRDRDIRDRHPDDVRWPSPHSGEHGVVIDRFSCSRILNVEFSGTGRPRAFIHESFCKLMPGNREKSDHRRGLEW